MQERRFGFWKIFEPIVYQEKKNDSPLLLIEWKDFEDDAQMRESLKLQSQVLDLTSQLRHELQTFSDNYHAELEQEFDYNLLRLINKNIKKYESNQEKGHFSRWSCATASFDLVVNARPRESGMNEEIFSRGVLTARRALILGADKTETFESRILSPEMISSIYRQMLNSRTQTEDLQDSLQKYVNDPAIYEEK